MIPGDQSAPAAASSHSLPPHQPGSSSTSPKPETVKTTTTTVEFVRPWLYPKQTAAIYDERRISCIEASTKAGKTVGCIIWLTEQAIFGGGDGRNYWWVAPVSTQADIAYTRMLRYLPKGTFTANRTLKTIVLFNGSVIWFKGADRPDTLYGEDVHAAVIDEASRVKETAWEAVRSTLVATRGKLRLIGNVKGRRNWFYRLARRAEQGHPDMGYHKITAHDAVHAGVLVSDEIESARGQMSDHAFRELFLAEPSDDEGNPFGIPAINACVAPLTGLPPAVWGWDLGKSIDWTVGIALDHNGHACRFERWQKIPWPDTIDRIRKICGTVPSLVDSTGLGDPVLELLQQRPGVVVPQGYDFHKPLEKLSGTSFQGFKFTAASKQQLMENLAVAIQGKQLSYPEGAIVLELTNFEYEYTRLGVKYSAPEGFHDDCVCALALAQMHRGHARRPMVISDNLLAATRLPAPPRRG